MEKEAFVMVSENEVQVCTVNGYNKRVRFEHDDYKDFDEFVSAVVFDCLKASDMHVKGVELVLGSDYYNYGEQMIAGVRSGREGNIKVRNFSMPISENVDTDCTVYFESNVDYICKDKLYEMPTDIPLLQKYFKHKSFVSWNRGRLTSLKAKLAEYGIEVSSVVSLGHFINAMSNSYSGSNAVVTVCEKHTCITIFNDGRIVNVVRLPYGSIDIVKHVSDAFGLSYRNSRILVDMYGFVSVPQQYVRYAVKVPIFEKVNRNVMITDLSYEIQSELKRIFGMYYSELKKYDIENVVLAGLPVVDANVLFQMMTHYECNIVTDMKYNVCVDLCGVVAQYSYSRVLVPEEKPEVETVSSVQDGEKNEKKEGQKSPEMPQGQPRWIASLVDRIKTSAAKIDAIMLE